MDLKMPKALINRVSNNGYSKRIHFQEMDLKISKALSNRVFRIRHNEIFSTSGTKLKKMIKEHV